MIFKLHASTQKDIEHGNIIQLLLEKISKMENHDSLKIMYELKSSNDKIMEKLNDIEKRVETLEIEKKSTKSITDIEKIEEPLTPPQVKTLLYTL